ncbi:hypothetical protein BH18CHL2_BH18CHL2_06450 [soil metagenome]
MVAVAWLAAIALVVWALALIAATWSAPLPPRPGFRGWVPVAATLLATVGARIAMRQPRNAVGWLLLSIGVVWALASFCEEYLAFGGLQPEFPPLVGVVAWLHALTPHVVIGLGGFALLLFPDGRLPSRRWVPVAVGLIVLTLVLVATYAFAPRPLSAYRIANPFGLEALRPHASTVALVMDVLYVARAAIVLVPAFALLQRLRAARGDRRQQLKWVVSAGVLAALAFFVNTLVRQNPVLGLIEVGAYLAVPVAIGIAMLRYHLYDIDVIIRRTLVYSMLSVVLVAAYVGAIFVLQRLLQPMTGGSQVAVSLSTIAVIAAFQPVRVFIQRRVDRRFYRHRYNAEKMLDAFASRLRDELDLDTLRSELLSAVDDALTPRHASLWLRDRDGAS